MEIQYNKSLKTLNTFGVKSQAATYGEINALKELRKIIKNNKQEIFILGGGSNILLPERIENKLVLKNNLLGIQRVRDHEKNTYVSAMSGESWQNLVEWCVERNLGGLENLSLIPGTVGAAPIQNIGAYGEELKNKLSHLYAIHLKTGKRYRFSNKKCKFGYRDSIFKNELRGEYFITEVIFRLPKIPKLNLQYGDIQKIIDEKNVTNPTIKDVSEVVIAIRKSKLPDPSELGNAGSFFKNILVAENDFKRLRREFPEIPHYISDNNLTKIPSAWLIEQCGWKGKKVGNVGCHEKQALVLVNHGGASGSEIKTFAEQIIDSVQQKFNVTLVPEINILF